MSKLYARAKVKLENALADYRKISNDDAYVDDCCYNLQQAIEMMLKYMVEMTGHNYVENHDIRAQINSLDAAGVQIPARDKLRSLAVTINEWETKSRYSNTFTALIDDINDAIAIAQKLSDYCDSLVEEL